MINITLFIDADNISYFNYSKIYEYLKENIENNKIDVKIFGNFSTRSLNRWKKVTNEKAIFINIPLVKNKNITDHFIIVEAMKDLYSKNIDIFVLASDDVDFLPLYEEIKRNNTKVWQASQNIENTKFLDDIVDFRIDVSKQTKKDEIISDDELKKMVLLAFDKKSINGIALLGDVKFWMDKNIKEFSIDKTNFNKFSKLIKHLDLFLIIEDDSEIKIKKKL